MIAYQLFGLTIIRAIIRERGAFANKGDAIGVAIPHGGRAVAIFCMPVQAGGSVGDFLG